MSKLVSKLSYLAMQAPELGAKALEQTGEDIVAIIQQLVPVDTGALRDSYVSEKVSDELVVVGSDLEYAPVIEFGGGNQPYSQPHFIPAFHQAKETFKTRLKEALGLLG